jgi:hypothetical protein
MLAPIASSQPEGATKATDTPPSSSLGTTYEHERADTRHGILEDSTVMLAGRALAYLFFRAAANQHIIVGRAPI